MAKCRYWLHCPCGGLVEPLSPVHTGKCPSNIRPYTCDVGYRKFKNKTIKGYVALNKAGIAYAFKPASQSDYWDKRVWTKATITYKDKK